MTTRSLKSFLITHKPKLELAATTVARIQRVQASRRSSQRKLASQRTRRTELVEAGATSKRDGLRGRCGTLP